MLHRRYTVIIDDYKDKKIIEYLEPGGKYLLNFHSGLGDLIMFLPIYYAFKAKYAIERDCEIKLYVQSGQEELFGEAEVIDESQYEIVASLNYPMAVHSGETKAERCAKHELGMTDEDLAGVPEFHWLPKIKSPIVGCHFQGTALPDSVNCPEAVARQIWQEIKDFGKMPLETHFCHLFHNPVNSKYSFIDNSARNYKANVSNLIGLIQQCGAFIGVASGPFVAAMATIPKATFYLEKSHPLETYTRQDVPKIHVDKYVNGTISEWLKGVYLEQT